MLRCEVMRSEYSVVLTIRALGDFDRWIYHWADESQALKPQRLFDELAFFYPLVLTQDVACGSMVSFEVISYPHRPNRLPLDFGNVRMKRYMSSVGSSVV
ncbi:unnamed protein product [Clonostachys solani]|uniref:Uncharacterized protein n=1 Tax=Clonostachys solani TaxID=160281 RepID=A0A9N9ZBU4_9HYPO|nr:unnamed protein product [Clonostachys solani]